MRLAFWLMLPRDEVGVPVVRHLIASSLRRIGVAEDSVGDIQIAVTEACTNVLQHAMDGEDQYEVQFLVEGSLCSIRVCDKGAGFDQGALDVGGRGLSAEGGRGIQLMKAAVDRLQFVTKPEDGTIVVLEKELQLQPESVLRD